MRIQRSVRAFYLAALMTFLLPMALSAQPGVGLDNWFNRELNSKTGKLYHYTWSDSANSGFSQLGGWFMGEGARLVTVDGPPTSQLLRSLAVYIIVDPDTTRENPAPHYVSPRDVKTISHWVKRGGVLLLMANDGPNSEFTHFNRLAGVFGFQFRPLTLNPVEGRNWEMGAETNLPTHPLFEGVSKIYMKEVAPILLSKKAQPVLKDGPDIFIAEAAYGRGYVLAVGDPWLYNEYVDHNRLPEDFENDKAAVNLARHLLGKAR